MKLCYKKNMSFVDHEHFEEWVVNVSRYGRFCLHYCWRQTVLGAAALKLLTLAVTSSQVLTSEYDNEVENSVFWTMHANCATLLFIWVLFSYNRGYQSWKIIWRIISERYVKVDFPHNCGDNPPRLTTPNVLKE